MKLLLLSNFVFISLYPIQWWTQQSPSDIFANAKVGFISLFVRLFWNYPIHCFVMSISKSKCDKKLSKLFMKLLLLYNFVFISLCPIQWWTQQSPSDIFAWAKVGCKAHSQILITKIKITKLILGIYLDLDIWIWNFYIIIFKTYWFYYKILVNLQQNKPHLIILPIPTIASFRVSSQSHPSGGIGKTQ